MSLCVYVVSWSPIESPKVFDTLEAAMVCAIEHMPAKICLNVKTRHDAPFVADWTATVKRGGIVYDKVR